MNVRGRCFGINSLDGVTDKLCLSHSLASFEPGWWLDLLKGWRGLQPLQDLLESYASTFCHVPDEEPER